MPRPREKTPPKKKQSSNRRACRDAYEAFNRNPVIGGVKITCIPEPPHFESIDGYGKNPEARKFKRIEFPEIEVIEDDDGNVIDTRFEGMTDEEELEFLKKVYKYRTEGYWFYNNDKLEYITGDHWYYLNLMKIKVKYRDSRGILKRGRDYPMFIDKNRDWFLMWQEVEKNPYCFGMVYVTNRRDGKSYRAMSTMLNNATMIEDAGCGIQAQNEKFASSLFDEVVRLWRELPEHEFFSPVHAGDDSPSRMLEFRAPKKRSSKKRFFKKKKTLNSWIDFRATTPAAYDGEGLWRYLLDEASKIQNHDVYDIVSIVKETMADGAQAIGKMIITSTAENLGGKTLKRFEDFWKDSNPAIQNDFGQTPSGFLRLFQGADMGYRYEPDEDGKVSKKFNKPTIDEWGYSDREAARNIILELRKNKTGDALIQFIRKYPLTEEEAFMYAENTCPFDTVKINDQRNYNEDLRVSGNLDVVKGDFIWELGLDFQRSKFVPSHNGQWFVSWMPEEEDRNKYEYHMNVARPTRNYVYLGVDPFDHNMTEDGKRFSNGAAVALCMGYPTHPHKGFVATYNNRPETANKFYEEMLKAAMFFSSPIIVESQKHGMINWFQDKGFGGFIENNPLDEKVKGEGVSTRSEDTRNAMINSMIAFVHDNIGKKSVKIADDEWEEVWGDCPFDDLLDDMVKFNPAKWTPSDLTVAAMLSLLSTKKREYSFSQPKLNFSDFFFVPKS